jgi:glutamate-1-semialdehyde 2,1-aminomutase/neamine transaminase/2'-deamino-2'-hydroxyneamine transaminase/neomycin C transaminase
VSDAQSLIEEARRVIAGGVPGFHRLFPADEGPLLIAMARGAEVTDEAGRSYIDFILGKGPVILGHAHEGVVDAVYAAIRSGNLAGLGSALLVRVAQAILSFFPPGHQVRFHKSGSEACAAAVRMARAHTGRRWILSCGYHGWHDWAAGEAPGVVSERYMHDFAYDTGALAEALNAFGDDVAAVFVEPQPGLLDSNFYTTVAEAAHGVEALFILDEVKSGMRTPAFTVASTTRGVHLVVLSKAIANGHCVSCTIGASDLMSLADRLHVSGTFDLETGPLAAVDATLAVLKADEIPRRLCSAAQGLAGRLNNLFKRVDQPAKAFATGAGFRVAFLDEKVEDEFYRRTRAAGVLLYPYDNQFLCAAHTPVVLDEALQRVEHAVRGVAPSAGFGWSQAEPLSFGHFPNRKRFKMPSRTVM